MAIFFALRAASDGADPDCLDLLDAAEETLAGAGFQLPLLASASILAVRLLPVGLQGSQECRRSELARACALARRLGQQNHRPEVELSVCVHVGRARVGGAADAAVVEGGSVLQMAEWILVGDLDGVRITQEVAAEISTGA